MNYFLHLVVYFEIYVITAMSLNLLTGYCGLFTLAHASFFAVGAYTLALSRLVLGLDFATAALLSLVVSAVLSLFVSLPAWRFRGDYFVLMSLAAATMIQSVLHNWTSPGEPVGSLANLTNGPFGISGIAKPGIAGLVFTPLPAIALVYGFVALVCAAAVFALVSSAW